MAGITTCMVNSFKQELLQGGHCFEANQVLAANSHTNSAITELPSTANLSVGMLITGPGLTGANTVVAIINSTAVVISNATSSTVQQNNFTFSGDTFKMALIKHTPTGTYDRLITRYAQVTGNTDEASGAGYSAGGLALTTVSPSIPDSNTAVLSFSS